MQHYLNYFTYILNYLIIKLIMLCHCDVLVTLYHVLEFLGSKRLFLCPSGHILQTKKTSLEVAAGGGPTSVILNHFWLMAHF
jgi:hypothetical protein